MKRFLLLILALLLLSGCAEKSEVTEEADKTQSQTVDTAETQTVPADISQEGEMITQRDLDSNIGDAKRVELSAELSELPFGLELKNGNIIVREEGKYLFSGEYEGSIIVDADQCKPHLVFEDLTLTCKKNAPFYILNADKVVVTLVGQNLLSNTEGFESDDENGIDSTVFSKQDLSFNGNGTLTVESPLGHGIVSKDDLVFAGGSYSITSQGHGIDANDSVRVTNSRINAKSQKDAIRAENSEDAELGFIYIEDAAFELSCEGDAISAGAYLYIEDGNFNILCRGGAEGSIDEDSSAKGIKASGELVINDGSFNIEAPDDCIHSDSDIRIEAGNIALASGDDGIHADKSLTVNAGDIEISQCYEGLEAFDITINGGSISIYATDDGINGAGGNDQSAYQGFGGDRFGGGTDNGGSIVINQGTLFIDAMGDGLDSNGSLDINGGEIILSGPTTGDTANLDYATNGSIHGGSFIATGAAGMNIGFDSNSTQGSIMIYANGKAGASVVLKDSLGNIIAEHCPTRDFAAVTISSPEIKEGESYTLTVDSQSFEINMTSISYSNGMGMGNMPGQGGKPGGMPGDMPGGKPDHHYKP